MRVPRFLSGRCGQIKKEAHGELPPWASIHFSSGRSNRGYATPRPPPGSSSEPGLESRYNPQKGQCYYHNDNYHYDDNQVVVTHSSTSLETYRAPEGSASLEEPEEQQQDQEYQKNDYKYRYEPTPHVLASLAKDLSLTNERQYEHDQKDHRQYANSYGESPVYPPSPRSPSLGGRLPQYIPFQTQTKQEPLRKSGAPFGTPHIEALLESSLHHATHSTGGHGGCLFLGLGHDYIRGHNKAAYGRSVLQRRSRDHRRVRYTGRDEVLVLGCQGVEAYVAALGAHLVHHDRAVGPCVLGDLADGLLACPVDDPRSRALVTL